MKILSAFEYEILRHYVDRGAVGQCSNICGTVNATGTLTVRTNDWMTTVHSLKEGGYLILGGCNKESYYHINTTTLAKMAITVYEMCRQIESECA